MDPNSIFISQNEANKNADISGKLTYTSILESIPENKLEKPIREWNKQYKTEWRWRFLRIKIIEIKDNKQINKEKHVVEISYLKYNSNKRMYFNRFGNWVEDFVDPTYDLFIEKEYYVYTHN